AEDGIRDWSVTGVQTCALPIYQIPEHERVGRHRGLAELADHHQHEHRPGEHVDDELHAAAGPELEQPPELRPAEAEVVRAEFYRSEERRVGKERRSWGGGDSRE